MSRYVQLATLFRSRIASGKWPVGQRIPTLEQLIGECGVARATLRQALGVLESEGLIARQRSKGTVVTRRPDGQQWCALQTDWAGMLQSRENARIELLSQEGPVALPDMPLPIGRAAAAYHCYRRRHWNGEQPFLLTGVYVERKLAESIPPDRLTTQTAIRMVAELPGVHLADAHQTFTAGTADMDVADLLQIPLNAPVMHLDRFATDASGCLVVASLGIYRADVVRIEISLGPH